MINKELLSDFFDNNPELMFRIGQLILDAKFPEQKMLDELYAFDHTNLAEAISFCELSVKAFPDFSFRYYKAIATIYSNMALEKRDPVQYKYAIEYIYKSINSLTPKIFNYKEELSWLFHEIYFYQKLSKNFDQALDALNISIALNGSTYNMISMSELLIGAKKYETALLLLNGCISSILPKNAQDCSQLQEAHGLRKDIFEKLGKIQEAENEQNLIVEYSYKEIDYLINPSNS